MHDAPYEPDLTAKLPSADIYGLTLPPKMHPSFLPSAKAMEGFSLADLPEACIANVLSFTSPRDACRLSLVCSTFRSVADSDAVWGSFLPPDSLSIISQSSLSFSSKKHLYLTLSDKPLLIDDGHKSFWLDKWCGKKCYMLSARELVIVWIDTPRYWRWTSVGDARFAEVAELVGVCWLEIRGRLNTRMLSPSTLYAAYLVFKLTSAAFGFEHQPVEVSIGIVGGHTHKRTVYLDTKRGRRRHCQVAPRRSGIFNRTRIVGVEAPFSTQNVDLQYPNRRADRWLEIELGEFFNEGGDDKDLEMGVYEIKALNWKGGLIVQGFEIRPKLRE